MGAVYSSLGRTKVLYATSLVPLGAKAKFLRRKPSVLVVLKKFQKCVDPNPYYQRWLDQIILPTERFPKFGYEGNNQREFVCDADEKKCYEKITAWYIRIP